MTLTLPNNIANGTTADAAPVEENYNLIEQYINDQCVLKDGSVAMGAPLLLWADPTQPLHAATKAYVDAVFPIGIMMPYGGNTSPDDAHWKLCNGQGVSKTTFQQLFACIGYRYSPEGTSGDTFYLPNMRGRVPIGFDEREEGADTRFDTTGKTGGSFAVPIRNHVHPHPHTHPQTVHNHPMPHTHEHPHTHPIPHSHPTAITTATRQNSTPGATASLMTASGTGVSDSQTNNPVASAPQPSTPNSGAVSEATTGGVSTANTSNSAAVATGAVSVTDTSNPTGGVNTPDLVPPYVTMSYIIRVA